MSRMPVLVLAVVFTATCGGTRTPAPETKSGAPSPGSFGDDLQFLQAHTPIVVLSSADGQAQVAIAPGYQGRVMTSTADGAAGTSYGYLHRSGIALNARQPHMTVLGGEDRFWLGPEGGQYGLYFPPGAAFDADHWQVPEPIDWGAWAVAHQSAGEIAFTQPMTVKNYSGTAFTLRVDRTIRLLDRAAATKALGVEPGPGTRVVAYESDNTVTNTGTAPWRQQTGLVSIWILSQLRPGPHTTVVIPFNTGSEAERGPIVNDKYFGAIPPDRLHVGDGVLFFRADGRMRGKIGMPKPRARDVAGSYDADGRVLTIKQVTIPGDTPAGYVNSMWERQARPYGGDVVNSYNDGPLGPGQPPLGPFYEIESSSPALALAPNASANHVHRTIHLQGPEAELNVVAKAVLGVSLEDIKRGLQSN